ncbi:MAG TPA: hypothetical protein VEM35_04105 [Rhizomicrobium sp.]|nr:hypothetical protein [Rhizomicrobium sp.]
MIAFSAPVILLSAGATLAINVWLAATVLVAGAVLVGFPMLQCAIRDRRDSLPNLALH